jgi:hypothetical protein
MLMAGRLAGWRGIRQVRCMIAANGRFAPFSVRIFVRPESLGSTLAPHAAIAPCRKYYNVPEEAKPGTSMMVYASGRDVLPALSFE